MHHFQQSNILVFAIVTTYRFQLTQSYFLNKKDTVQISCKEKGLAIVRNSWTSVDFSSIAHVGGITGASTAHVQGLWGLLHGHYTPGSNVTIIFSETSILFGFQQVGATMVIRSIS